MHVTYLNSRENAAGYMGREGLVFTCRAIALTGGSVLKQHRITGTQESVIPRTVSLRSIIRPQEQPGRYLNPSLEVLLLLTSTTSKIHPR